MANPNKVVGRAKVTLSSIGLLDTDGSTTIDIGGAKRTPVQSDNTAGSFSESNEASKVETSILMKANTSLSMIRAIDNDTLTVEFDTGRTFIIRNAYSADVPSGGSSDGKAKVVFQGPPAEEIL